jgi:CheY-like chemotaxis protein
VVATYDQKVLLVGREFLETRTATDWFLKRRRLCLVASTLREVHELTKSSKFDLVLSNYHLPDGTGFALMERFRNLPVSLFLSHRVENGCIWLPAIVRGVPCWGAASLKPRVFNRLLAELVSGNREFHGRGEYQDIRKN